jgi:hypothetical protein
MDKMSTQTLEHAPLLPEVFDDNRDRVVRADTREAAMTIHPIVYVAARHPQILAEHAKAYFNLAMEESRRALSELVVHALLYVATVFLGLLGVLFGGVAVLLYATVQGQMRNGWLLIALPSASLLMAVACFIIARALPVNATMSVVGQQFKADMDVVHEAGQL